MTPSIAVVGMACHYPDATSPAELWENALAGRKAFRRIPAERLSLDDYWSADAEASDRTYSIQAAVIRDYQFDRSRFRVPNSTFRAADLAHWLALDVADRALGDAGFPGAEGLDRAATGVLVGNSLTGEFSRANVMRLRWPYVRRTLEAALAHSDWTERQRGELLADIERRYKAPFPEVGDETLAGGLSNTIAGRICNHFDLGGGGYTVDGACASSLLAIANSCSALAAGDLDVALAGGVDLSLDPFELVGFAKVGALAREAMRVYDARSAGFWPGEGCGFVVLMRWEDAVAQNRRIYAVVRGWGISSDGKGGITRPEVEGQTRALRRAYRRAGYGIDTVTYFEGHGTGTAVGDATELRTLSEARRDEDPAAPPAVIGSVKAIIGHTKAAAGVAGFLKTVMALRSQVLPPSVGVEQPHAHLRAARPALKCLGQAEPWPVDRPLRAGVNAMGFGGINAHVTLEGIGPQRRTPLRLPGRRLAVSYQDAELFLFRAATPEALLQQVERIAPYAARLAQCELGDLAAQLARSLPSGSYRAAIVAETPSQLDAAVGTLLQWLSDGKQPPERTRVDDRGRVLLGSGTRSPSVGFLFPGQGFPAHRNGGAWRRRFEDAAEIYARSAVPTTGDGTRTDVAQPAIITASLVGLHVLDRLGVQAAVAIGHSLGELAAYHWAGAFDEDALLRLASARGKAMAESTGPAGTMASIRAGADTVRRLIGDLPVVLAGLNAPKQTVVSGPTAAVEVVVERAEAAGLGAVNLQVSHAFHSPLIADSAAAIAKAARKEHRAPLARPVVSTVTGGYLPAEQDLVDLLQRQVTTPVRFMKAVRSVREPIDLWIEVGPGHVLTRLAAESTPAPCMAMDVGSETLIDLLQITGRLFVLGAPLEYRALMDDRFFRPFDLDWKAQFFTSPCEVSTEERPASGLPEEVAGAREETPRQDATGGPRAASEEELGTTGDAPASPKELVRQLVAERAELPIESVQDGDRFLVDLHLSSIAVGQIVADATRHLDLPPPASPTDYADATVATLAAALDEQLARGGAAERSEETAAPAGVDTWVRPFTVELVEERLPRRRVGQAVGEWTLVAAEDDHQGAELLRALRETVPGRGVVVCLPDEPSEAHVQLLLDGVQTILGGPRDARFVLVERGWESAALARTLHLEHPSITTCVVRVPPDDPRGVGWVVDEVRCAHGYHEAHYDGDGQRRVPRWRSAPASDDLGPLPLGAGDVLLITGGGKGIAAHCALELARDSAVRLVLLGRSRDGHDEELSANLKRMRDAGIDFRYVSVDLCDAGAVRRAVGDVQQQIGAVTAVLHAAGVNRPQPLSTLDHAAFRRTLLPKVDGLDHVLAAVDPRSLRWLITFGSIIARTGMQGEADYGVANEWLRQRTERWQTEHPDCRCLTLEWSVWSGAGMGERLGRIESLRSQGVLPIGLDEGVRMLRSMIRRPPRSSSVVVTSRFGDPPTVRIEKPELPLLRFLEQPRTYIPGVELVVDSRLSHETDPYLADHVYQGTALLPAVVGLEAMAQAVMTVTEERDPPAFERVQFERPVAVPAGADTTIRVATLVRADRVDVVLRSAETHFQVDHFRATCRLGEAAALEDESHAAPEADELPRLAIDPQRDLYGELLFHRGRFRRIAGYRRLRAKECVAELDTGDDDAWFSDYLPGKLVLGNPAVRDAAIHAIQACIPHGTILPTGVERLAVGPEPVGDICLVHARERSHQGDAFLYDVDVRTPAGRLCQRWVGLQLRRVGRRAATGPWIEPLLGPYLERRIGELAAREDVSIVLETEAAGSDRGRAVRVPPRAAAHTVPERKGAEVAPGNGNGNGHAARRLASDHAIRAAVGTATAIHRRADGKPETAAAPDVSVSPAGALTMAICGGGPVACDCEQVVSRSAELWKRLLGDRRFALAESIRDQMDHDLQRSATRMWTVLECLKKAGRDTETPVTLAGQTDDHWVLFAAGDATIASWVTVIRSFSSDVAMAFLLGPT